MDWPVRWTRSGYRYVDREKVAWIDFRPCYRCTLPREACAPCDKKTLYQERKRQQLDRQRRNAPGDEIGLVERRSSDGDTSVSGSRGGE